MSLVQQAHEDLGEIMHSEDGAVWDCTITSPGGVSYPFKCRMADNHAPVETGTDVVVTGRQVSISVFIPDLVAVGFENIYGVASNSAKPWKVEFENIIGQSGTYKVVETNPDYGIGNIILFLEVMRGV